MITILGKRWQLLLVSASELEHNGRRDCDGKCDSPDTPGKAIRAYRGLSDERLLTVVIHEMLHAADWTKTEEWVEEVSEDIARAIKKLGYRRSEPHGP